MKGLVALSAQPTHLARASVVFQSAKLGNIPRILDELAWAKELLDKGLDVGRVYGVSGGALTALAFSLALAAHRDPACWGAARTALSDFGDFLRRARSRDVRSLNLNPLYGVFNLRPLRLWLAGRLSSYGQKQDAALSDLSVPLYLCALDQDGILNLFGPPDDGLQFQYQFVRVGPPRDAPIVDAMLAALSTMLSTEPAWVPKGSSASSEGGWFRDCRPAIADAGAIVADLEAADPRPLVRRQPYTPIRPWRLNWITSSFIMHSQHERNQALLASYYLDLLQRHRALEAAYRALADAAGLGDIPAQALPALPQVCHVDLPYVGSTEAFTNMRQSVENKEALMARFEALLDGQLDRFAFDRPANIIYGAGGFSGILAGLVTTRAVAPRFAQGGGEIRQIYGVSAGVLNGFFHAVQLAGARHPDVFRPAAANALADLEAFIAHITPGQVARINCNPAKFWQGWANLEPLEAFLLDWLAAYTGARHPERLTFDDISLPLTVAVARGDGFTDFLGMTVPERRMRFAGHTWRVRSAPVVHAILAGWSMNTYIMPTVLGDQAYRDGGGTFYDPGLFVACLDSVLTNLLNVHLDEPEGHSYRIPPRPNLARIILDTHNYTFPEERRRMRLLTDLLYAHARLRARYAALLARTPARLAAIYPLPPDVRQEWDVPYDQILIWRST